VDGKRGVGWRGGVPDCDTLDPRGGDPPPRRRAGDPEAELDDAHAGEGPCHADHPAAARSASISATVLGAAAESTSWPVVVTSTSSSMRMPMPRKASGTSPSPAT